MKKFYEDLEKYGKPCEAKVLLYVRKFYPDAVIVEGNDPGKDIISPKTGKSWEVKNCELAKVFVPIETNTRILAKDEKPSGILVTTATYWVIFCHQTYYMIKTDILKEQIVDCEIRKLDIEDQTKTMKLLPITRLVKYAHHSWKEVSSK